MSGRYDYAPVQTKCPSCGRPATLNLHSEPFVCILCREQLDIASIQRGLRGEDDDRGDGDFFGEDDEP